MYSRRNLQRNHIGREELYCEPPGNKYSPVIYCRSPRGAIVFFSLLKQVTYPGATRQGGGRGTHTHLRRWRCRRMREALGLSYNTYYYYFVCPGLNPDERMHSELRTNYRVRDVHPTEHDRQQLTNKQGLFLQPTFCVKYTKETQRPYPTSTCSLNGTAPRRFRRNIFFSLTLDSVVPFSCK